MRSSTAAQSCFVPACEPTSSTDFSVSRLRLIKPISRARPTRTTRPPLRTKVTAQDVVVSKPAKSTMTSRPSSVKAEISAAMWSMPKPRVRSRGPLDGLGHVDGCALSDRGLRAERAEPAETDDADLHPSLNLSPIHNCVIGGHAGRPWAAAACSNPAPSGSEMTNSGATSTLGANPPSLEVPGLSMAAGMPTRSPTVN